MTRIEAFELLRDYYEKPVFSVRIGVCSPQIEHINFECALHSLDQCAHFTTEYMEYAYIYVDDYVVDADKLHEALKLFNLGCGRHALNTKVFT